MQVTMRFYEELNNYIADKFKKKNIQIEVHEGSTISDILEIFSVPPQEVHLILVNGQNCTLEKN